MRAFAALDEPGLAIVPTADMADLWTAAEEDAMAVPVSFRPVVQGQALGRRMRAHLAAQQAAVALCVAKLAGGCSANGLECAAGHHICQACFAAGAIASCALDGCAASRLVCSRTGAVSAPGQVPCHLFADGGCAVAALPEDAVLRQLVDNPDALQV
jgi:hypothetical protein